MHLLRRSKQFANRSAVMLLILSVTKYSKSDIIFTCTNVPPSSSAQSILQGCVRVSVQYWGVCVCLYSTGVCTCVCTVQGCVRVSVQYRGVYVCLYSTGVCTCVCTVQGCVRVSV